MNEQLPTNPYEPPGLGGQPTPAKVILTTDEKLNAIASTRRRLKNGESRTAIYDDWKHTEAETAVRNVILHTPSIIRKKQYFVATWVTFLLFVTHVVTSLMLSSDFFRVASVGLVIAVPLFLIVAYFVYISARFGYTAANIAIGMFFIWRFWIHLIYDRGDFVYKTTFMVCSGSGLLAILMSMFLLFRLFPDYPPFTGYRRTVDGEPLFED
jgi:hypothetical protein